MTTERAPRRAPEGFGAPPAADHRRTPRVVRCGAGLPCRVPAWSSCPAGARGSAGFSRRRRWLPSRRGSGLRGQAHLRTQCVDAVGVGERCCRLADRRGRSPPGSCRSAARQLRRDAVGQVGELPGDAWPASTASPSSSSASRWNAGSCRVARPQAASSPSSRLGRGGPAVLGEDLLQPGRPPGIAFSVRAAGAPAPGRAPAWPAARRAAPGRTRARGGRVGARSRRRGRSDAAGRVGSPPAEQPASSSTSGPEQGPPHGPRRT